MKKWLLAAGLGLALATSAQAADKIAIVNMGSLFQQVAQVLPLRRGEGFDGVHRLASRGNARSMQ